MRYPKAFENTASVLFHDFRNETRICRTTGEAGCESSLPARGARDSRPERRPLVDSRLGAVASQLRRPRGGEQDCSSQFGLGFGALEQPAHNTMHDAFIGGDMSQPAFAALDPIFFSFHCYIDLLWAQWQENNDTDTDLEARLCGLFKDREHRQENRFRVRDALETESSSATSTSTCPGEQAPVRRATRARAPFPAHPAFDFVVSARKQPERVRTLDITIPAPGFEARTFCSREST